MKFAFVLSTLALSSTCYAALVANWENCKIGADTCNSGYKCCVGTKDVSSGKATCRQNDCSTSTVTTSSTGKLVANWETCQTGDRCNAGYVCCAASGDGTKKTCRAGGSGCNLSTGGSNSNVATSSSFYSGFSGKVPQTTGNSDTFAVTLPGGFNGLNKGIGSWFRSVGDSTNGKSWCGYPYKDYTNGFAPDIGVITDWTYAVWGNPNWSVYGKRYCGLEAVVYNPNNGRALTMYITDGFDSKWVRTPGSIDIHKQKWDYLFGRESWNKNDVIQGVEWKFTGRRSQKYSFQGSGDP
ncbi:hypothetical protein HK098_000550 [Nowakowskiella sp. JEL0407]|nr:hypothetical protein HK098_000550 [Nowakowskiella sp. JEL0407]